MHESAPAATTGLRPKVVVRPANRVDGVLAIEKPRHVNGDGKTLSRARDWRESERALTSRVDIANRLGEQSVATWTQKNGFCDGQRRNSNPILRTALPLRPPFRLPLRRTESFIAAHLTSKDLEFKVRDRTSLVGGNRVVAPWPLSPTLGRPIARFADSPGLESMGPRSGNPGTDRASKHRSGGRKRHFGKQPGNSNRSKGGTGRGRVVAGALGLLACPVISLMGQVVVTGTVTDRTSDPVPSATVVIASRDNPGAKSATLSDEQGAFDATLHEPGRYLLSVAHADFFPIEDRPVDLIDGANIVNIELIRSEDPGTALNVYPDQQLAAEAIVMSQALAEQEIDAIPTTRSTKQRIQGVTAVLPGVLRSPLGDLHVHGSPAQETNWTLDGFSLSDPSSGRLEMTLGSESVQSVDLASGRYSAEAGKGAGGAMVLNSRVGGDEFKQRFTNFVPGVEFNRGLRFRDWRPRHNLSGPILEDRAWFFNSLDLLYEENFIPELPPGQDRTMSWSINNSLRLQAKPTPSQTLSSGLVVDYLHAPNSGLSPLSPMETTLDRRARRYFFNVRDQIVLSPESVLDFGYASYRSHYWGVPQGSAPFRITAFGVAGNYPIETFRVTGRDELRANLFAPAEWLGGHQLKAGLNLSHARYFQDVRRSAIEYFRVDGTRSGELSFVGSGEFKDSNLESGAYVQDRWAIRSRLVAEVGLRWDRDTIVGRGVLTPRFSLAFMPPGLGGARLSAGLGWVPAATYLRIFTRHRDQHSIYTSFTPDGTTPLDLPEVRFFSLDRTLLTIPSTRNLSASWRQRLPGETDLSVNFLRKRMRDGYAHVPTATGTLQDSFVPLGSHAVYLQLRNSRRDTYDSVEFSLSKPLPGSHRWFVSYTYSRAWSNAALEVDTNDSILISETAGRVSWDIPNRLVSWASFRMGEKTSVTYFAEWRDGFPFTVHDDNGKQVGPVNGRRLPRHFGLNVHIERKLSFLGHQWALRPGIDNVTNRPNYSFVNRNIDSPEFLNLYGRSPIKLVVRVRWLGRAED